MMVELQTIVIGLITAALGSLATIFAGVMLHRRETRRIDNEGKKIDNDAREIDERIMASHWARLIEEVARLDERVRAMEGDLIQCHEHKGALEMELARLRLTMIERGNSRNTAQMVVSQIHLEEREQRGRDARRTKVGDMDGDSVPE